MKLAFLISLLLLSWHARAAPDCDCTKGGYKTASCESKCKKEEFYICNIASEKELVERYNISKKLARRMRQYKPERGKPNHGTDSYAQAYWGNAFYILLDHDIKREFKNRFTI